MTSPADSRVLTICDTTQAFAETSGGIKTYLLEKRRTLLATTPHRHVLIVPGREDRTIREGRCTVHEVAAPLINGYEPYRFILRLDKVARLLRETDPDAIEVGSPYLLPWAAIQHRKRHPHCAVLGYYHTDFPEAYVGSTLRRTPIAAWAPAAVRISQWYARLVLRRFDRVLTGSPSLHATLQQLGIERIDRVPLGVDCATFHPDRRDRSIWPEWGLDPTRPIAIFAGRFDGEKRVRVLVDAIGRLSDTPVQLAFVGEGPARAELQRRSQCDPQLFVLPYQKSPPDLARLLASADLYVTAGPHETFGLSVVEAQACGLPVVGVDRGALVERVPPELGRLARTDDPEDFADQVRAIVADDLAAIGRRARAHVEQNFSWTRTVERWLEAVESAIGDRTSDLERTTRSGSPVRPTSEVGGGAGR